MEGGAKVGAVDAAVARGFGVVEVLAFGAVHLHAGFVRDVGLAHGEERVRVADDAWAFAEVGLFVFVELEAQSGRFWSVMDTVRRVRHTIFARPRVVTM